jgi:hypothetical protein
VDENKHHCETRISKRLSIIVGEHSHSQYFGCC